jgi:hypothetical protein
MRKPATARRVLPAPAEDDFFVRPTIEAIMDLIADLRCRLEKSGTPRVFAQVLLAEAHIAEAVGLLRTIQPVRSVGEPDLHRPSPRPPLHACKQVQRAGRRHQPQRIAV